MTLLDVRDLTVRFATRRGDVRALAGLSFSVDAGETLGIVGESGSGKTVALLALMGLLPANARIEPKSRARFAGGELLGLPQRQLARLRGSALALIFQEPRGALNPLLPIGLQLAEVLEVHRGLARREALSRAATALGEVGMPAPEERLRAFPHELSGGQCQRVGIAMALLCRPRLLLADEPTTALDVTIQAQILELLRDLQERHGTAIVLVTHDLGVVARSAARALVVYAGRAVEEASVEALFASPAHPYTQGLLASVPALAGPRAARLASIPGQPPDLATRSRGCAFAPRCARARARCQDGVPALVELGAHQRAACVELVSP